MSNVNTPSSNFKNRKIILQALPCNSSRNSNANSPVDQNSSFVKSNNFKRHNTFAGLSTSSPNNGILSPRNGNSNTPPYLSKLNNKATLFDFIIAPNKSPSNQKAAHSPTLINDFKNRFVQHQNKLKSQQTNVKVQKVFQSPLISQSNTDSQIFQNDQLSDIDCIKTTANNHDLINNEKKNTDYSRLGETVKNSLKSEELLKISLISDFYCQLILSIFHFFLTKTLLLTFKKDNFALTLNTELFFLFQLLTLNSIEDKRNCNPKGKS